ncbi:MAG: alanine dehydrogenase [candidate division WOR-3 bacterium]
MLSISIPKEERYRGSIERRVPLTPAGVKELNEYGVKIYIEKDAGKDLGFSDEEYTHAGAQIVFSKEEAFKRGDIVLKISPPKEEEIDLLSEGQTVFSFQDIFIVPKKIIEKYIQKKLTVIGFEGIEEKGIYPVLRISSEIAGKLAPQIAGRYLEITRGGLGILIGGLTGIPPADVVIVGGGTLGYYAARSFLGLGATVYILDVNTRRLEEIDLLFDGRVITAYATAKNIEKFVSFAEVLIGAVQIPGERAPIVIKREMLKKMRDGGVFIDFSIDRGGCSETSRPTPDETYVYKEEGIIHFCVPNVPSFVARTASHGINNAIIPYLKEMAKKGIEKTIFENPAIYKGTYIKNGKFIRKYTWAEGFPVEEIKI